MLPDAAIAALSSERKTSILISLFLRLRLLGNFLNVFKIAELAKRDELPHLRFQQRNYLIFLILTQRYCARIIF